jgi:hypothetical protein
VLGVDTRPRLVDLGLRLDTTTEESTGLKLLGAELTEQLGCAKHDPSAAAFPQWRSEPTWVLPGTPADTS